MVEKKAITPIYRRSLAALIIIMVLFVVINNLQFYLEEHRQLINLSQQTHTHQLEQLASTLDILEEADSNHLQNILINRWVQATAIYRKIEINIVNRTAISIDKHDDSSTELYPSEKISFRSNSGIEFVLYIDPRPLERELLRMMWLRLLTSLLTSTLFILILWKVLHHIAVKNINRKFALTVSRYQTLFEVTPLAIVTVDSNAKITDINPYFLWVMLNGKMTHSEILGMPIQELIPLEFGESEKDPFLQVLQGKELHIKAYHFPPTDQGISGWVGLKGIQLIKKNQISGAVFILNDINEQKQVESELLQSESMLRQIFNTIPIPLYWKNRDGIFQGCNRKFSEFVQADSVDHIIGKNFSSFFNSQFVETILKDEQRLYSIKGIVGHQTYSLTLPQKSRQRWVDAYTAPLINANDQVMGLLGSFEDISRRVEDEKELEQLRIQLQSQLNERNQLLTAITDIAAQIMDPEGWPQKTDLILAQLGHLANSHQVALYHIENHLSSTPSLHLNHIWSTSCSVSEHLTQTIDFNNPRYAAYKPSLLSDQMVTIDAINTKSRKVSKLNAHTNSSEVLIPLLVDNSIWGLMVFEKKAIKEKT